MFKRCLIYIKIYYIFEIKSLSQKIIKNINIYLKNLKNCKILFVFIIINFYHLQIPSNIHIMKKKINIVIK